MMEVEDNKKQHKINSKLRKKRQQLKQHKKQKKITKEKYNPEEAKIKFFQQTKSGKEVETPGIDLQRLKASLYRFVKVYSDDMEDFYDIWRNLDEGGDVNIEDVENEGIREVLGSICKCLPLTRVKNRYIKDQESKINLGTYIKIKTQEILEDCLEGDSLSEYSEGRCELSEEKKNKLTKIKEVKVAKKDEIGQKVEEVKKQKRIIREEKRANVPSRDVTQVLSVLGEVPKPVSKEVKRRGKQDQIDKIFGGISKDLKQPTFKASSFQEPIPQQGSAKSDAKFVGESITNNVLPFTKESVSYPSKPSQKSLQTTNPTSKKLSLIRTPQVPADTVDLQSLRELIKDGYLLNFPNRAKTSMSKNQV